MAKKAAKRRRTAAVPTTDARKSIRRPKQMGRCGTEVEVGETVDDDAVLSYQCRPSPRQTRARTGTTITHSRLVFSSEEELGEDE